MDELAARQRRLVEEAVGRVGGREDIEGRGVSESRMRTGERLENPDRAVRIDDPLAVALQIPELPGRRIIEREDDRRGPAR